LNIFKSLRLFFVFHSRDYKKLLYLTSLEKYARINDSKVKDLKYQGYASFYTKNYRHSQMCFEILHEKKKCSSKDYNYLAYIYARHNDKDKAIQSWCMSLEKNKFNGIAKKALDYIRDLGREVNLMSDDYFEKLIPKEPYLLPIKLILKIILSLIILSLICLAGYYGYIKINEIVKVNFAKEKPLNNIFLPDFNTNILEKPKENNVKYSYNEREIKSKFEKIKIDIINKNIVDAQIGINQIKLSNASKEVKFKTEMLESFIDEPDYAQFKNKISLEDYLKDQAVFNKIYITWAGRIVNLNIEKDKITFNLIIGDEKAGLIKGVIPVIFKKAIIVKNNDTVKVFGRILFDGNNTTIEGHFIIKNNSL